MGCHADCSDFCFNFIEVEDVTALALHQMHRLPADIGKVFHVRFYDLKHICPF